MRRGFLVGGGTEEEKKKRREKVRQRKKDEEDNANAVGGPFPLWRFVTELPDVFAEEVLWRLGPNEQKFSTT